ncbi:MAG: IS30 family transposase [Ignavibacteriae bacterium]|nr:IS30 family transposase [Ignavibacteriota bacterium]
MTNKRYNHISKEQRYQISVLLKAGHKVSFISEQLNIHHSTVYRELNRNSRPRGSYDANYANQYAEIRKERFAKTRKLNREMISFIKNKLETDQWSPEQIKGHCIRKNIPMVSHERIYQFIYEDMAKGGSLHNHLRTGNKKYKKRYGKHKKRRVIIKNKVSIDERPSVINNKERFGDWEIDTIVGKNHKGAIVTIAERKSNFILMRKLKTKNAKQLAIQTIRLLAPYKDLVHSITSDNGTEFAEHEYIAEKLQAKFYFAHPYSSWERGLNEYSNKLIRQYIPKKSDFNNFSDKYISEINLKLNNRPRKLLNYANPNELLFNNFP